MKTTKRRTKHQKASKKSINAIITVLAFMIFKLSIHLYIGNIAGAIKAVIDHVMALPVITILVYLLVYLFSKNDPPEVKIKTYEDSTHTVQPPCTISHLTNPPFSAPAKSTFSQSNNVKQDELVTKLPIHLFLLILFFIFISFIFSIFINDKTRTSKKLIYADTLGVSSTNNTESYRYTTEMAMTDDDVNLLNLICDKKDIDGVSCRHAKNYPNSVSCEVRLWKSKYEGRFISNNSNTIILDYGSDCEPHATNWGGSLIFENRNEKVTFIDYAPGLTNIECTQIDIEDSRESLICTYGWAGQGHVTTILIQYELSVGYKGDIDIFKKSLTGVATDSTGYFGANRVNCSSSFEIFEFGPPIYDLASNSLLVKARYIDEAVINKSCIPGSAYQDFDINFPPPADEAYIDPDDIKTGLFVVDPLTRGVALKSPVSEAAVR